MGRFDDHGQVISYERFGDTKAPAVILLMGLGMPQTCWPPRLIQNIVAEGFQVITMDNRDAGDSHHFTDQPVDQGDVLNGIMNAVIGRQVTQAKYTLSDMALDAVRLLDHLSVDRAHFVGFSMGGMIAQVVASQFQDRVATLTSISSASGHVRTGLGKLTAIWSLVREPKQDEAQEGYFRQVAMKLAGPLYPPTEEELGFLVEAVKQMPFDRQAMYRQLLAILASGDRSLALHFITAPTLVIHGKSDPLLPFAAGEETMRCISNATLWAIDGLGHQLPNKLMNQFGQRIAQHCHQHPA